jgi:hypothetical protein
MDPNQTDREKLVSAGLLKKTKNQHIWKNLLGVIQKTALILTVATCNQSRSLARAMLVSAYFAGVLIGVFFTPSETVSWALTIWGGWHLVCGRMTIVITFPIIIALEKANVRKIKGDRD